MNNPIYEFRCEIVDIANDDKVIVSAKGGIHNEKRVGERVLGLKNLEEEMAETIFWSMFRAFRNKQQKLHEENVNQNYIDDNISYLEDYFYKNVDGGTDDRDGFEYWMDSHEQGELIAIIDNAKSKEVKEQNVQVPRRKKATPSHIQR